MILLRHDGRGIERRSDTIHIGGFFFCWLKRGRATGRWLLGCINRCACTDLKREKQRKSNEKEFWLFARRGAVEGAEAVEVLRPELDESAVQALADELGEIAAFDG